MVIYETLYDLWYSMLPFLPKMLTSLVLLLIGWLIGWLIGRISKGLLKRLKVDNYIARGGKPLFRLSSILPVIFSWIVYLAFIQTAVQVLEISALVTLVGYVIAFLPGLIGAIVVTVVGYAIAEYVRQHVEDSKLTYSDLIGKMMFFLIIYIAVAMALPLIKIEATLMNNILLVIIGSFGLGMALAIGLGLKDTIAELAKKYKRKKK